MLRFFRPANVNRLRIGVSSNSVQAMSSHSRKGSPEDELREAQRQLDTVVDLYNDGKLKEALSKISYIESNYPTCSKATKYYRGKISLELLDQNGELDDLKTSFGMN